MVEVHAVENGDEYFEGSVTGARPHTRQRPIDTRRAMLDGDDRIGHSEREVVVGMHPHLRARIERVAKGGKALGLSSTTRKDRLARLS
jgi:hypothetical protein